MPTVDIETWFSTKLIDEDDFASNSDTKVPSQQSVKAYVDSTGGTGGGAEPGAYDETTWDGNTNAPTKDAVRDKIENISSEIDTAQSTADTAQTKADSAYTITDNLTTKGDIPVATAADTPSVISVGADGTVLTADSSESTGVKWAAGGSSGLSNIVEDTSPELGGHLDCNFKIIDNAYSVKIQDTESTDYFELFFSTEFSELQGTCKGNWITSFGDTKRYFYPYEDDKHDLGKSDGRWDNIYATNGTIQTSDIRQKKEINTLSDKHIEFIKNLNPVSFKFLKGTREHFGLIAQEVKEAMTESGIDDFAGYINDKETDSYGIRMSEFIAPLISTVQSLIKRVEELESKV